MRAIDTNVLIRAIVADNAAQTLRADALMRNHQIYIPVTVMLELEWVLRSRYVFKPKQIAEAIVGIAALGNVVLGEHDAVIAAADKYAKGWDFADALHHALSVGCDDFMTLDKELVKNVVKQNRANPKVLLL